MSFTIEYEGQLLPVESQTSVLEVFEKAGVPLTASCRAGVCQSCMVRARSGKVPARSQEGLKEHLKSTGHFLACVCYPENSLACEPAQSHGFRGDVTLRSVELIGPDIAKVRLSRPAGFECRPGQFITLKRKDGLARSYSIAASSDDHAYLDLHVRRIVGGQFSQWLHSEAQAGERMRLEGPKGDCYYYSEWPDEALTLIGTGTGLAPLYAIARDALDQGHRAPIQLYIGALSADRLYYQAELEALQQRYSTQFSYVCCVIQGESEGRVEAIDLQVKALTGIQQAKGGRFYLCGDPVLVQRLKKALFLAGASLRKIHADPFIGT